VLLPRCTWVCREVVGLQDIRTFQSSVFSGDAECDTKAVEGKTAGWEEVGESAVCVWLEGEVEK